RVAQGLAEALEARSTTADVHRELAERLAVVVDVDVDLAPLVEALGGGLHAGDVRQRLLVSDVDPDRLVAHGGEGGGDRVYGASGGIGGGDALRAREAALQPLRLVAQVAELAGRALFPVGVESHGRVEVVDLLEDRPVAREVRVEALGL